MKSSEVLRISKLWFQNKEIKECDIMSLKEFFKEFTIEELADMYKYRLQDDIAKDALKEIIMEKLNFTRDEEFQLWIKLF